MIRTDDFPTYPTLSECYRPVEEYQRLIEAAHSAPPMTAVQLSPLDAYLMHRFADLMPSPPAVIDLAGGMTGGASTIFWWSHSGITKLIPGAPKEDDDDSWRRFAVDGGERLGLDVARLSPSGWATDISVTLAQMSKAVPAMCPVLISMALAEDNSMLVPESLGQAFKTFHNPIVLVWPAGRVGASSILDECMAACRGGDLQLILPRELNPFLAQSGLAVIARADDGRAKSVLARIASSFDGNFQFINSVRDTVETAAKIAALEKRLAEATTGRPARQALDYPALIRRVRKAVAATLPAECHVTVVSKGDDELLRLGDRITSHFPQAANGDYAGHYPADSEMAITHLEEVRDAGAEYLLIPATALWWLDHYSDLTEYLALKYAEIYRADDTAVIFALGSAAKTRSVEHRCAALAEEIQRLRSETFGLAGGPRAGTDSHLTATMLSSSNGADNSNP
jgi:hypothetical protein